MFWLKDVTFSIAHSVFFPRLPRIVFKRLIIKSERENADASDNILMGALDRVLQEHFVSGGHENLSMSSIPRWSLKHEQQFSLGIYDAFLYVCMFSTDDMPVLDSVHK